MSEQLALFDDYKPQERSFIKSEPLPLPGINRHPIESISERELIERFALKWPSPRNMCWLVVNCPAGMEIYEFYQSLNQ